MTDFLSKLFVKDYKNYTDPKIRAKYGTFASAVGIFVNIMLALVKLFLGIITGAISITADALNNLSDVGTSVVSLVGFKLASKPADKEHPFGHARIDYIASMVVSFIILLVGAELLIDSVKMLFDSTARTQSIGILTFIILPISILSKLWLALFCRKIGKRIDSGALRAASVDSLSDAASTSAVLISAVVVRFTDFYALDAIMGIVVSGIIIIAGIKILNETKNSLLGEAPVDDVVESIKAIVSDYPEIIGIHDMMVHNYGPSHFIASFHAEVDGSSDIFKLHDMIDNVEKRINAELSIPCSIHMDPIVTDDEAVTRLKAFAKQAVSFVNPRLDMHDFRVVVGETHTNMIFDIVVPFDIKENPSDIVKRIQDEVQKTDPGCFCVITVDRS